MLLENGWLAWLSVVGAWLCFGSFAAPMKWKSVEGVHPFVFQCHRTFWVFVSAHLVLLYEPYEFTWWGVLSGMAWVPGGTAGVFAVQNVGIACGTTIWQSTAVLTSCLWSLLAKHDARIYSLRASASVVICLVCGMVGVMMAFNVAAVGFDKSKASRSKQREDEDGERHEQSQAETEREALIPRDQSDNAEINSGQRFPLAQRSTYIAVGIAAAVFNGILGGSSRLPQVYAPLHRSHFVISFATGALIVNAFLLVVFALFAKLWWRCEMPSPEFRKMLLPGMLCGGIWTAGNLCALYAVQCFGLAIGFSLVQCSVIVAGLWGILYYRELQGSVIGYWSMCCTLCLIGAAVFAYEQMATEGVGRW